VEDSLNVLDVEKADSCPGRGLLGRIEHTVEECLVGGALFEVDKFRNGLENFEAKVGTVAVDGRSVFEAVDLGFKLAVELVELADALVVFADLGD